IRTKIGDSFAMFLLSISACIRSERGCMWRPLTAEDVLSVSQLASANAAATAADAKSARTKGRRFNRQLPRPLGFPKPPPAQSRSERTPAARRRIADCACRRVKSGSFVLNATPSPPTAMGTEAKTWVRSGQRSRISPLRIHLENKRLLAIFGENAPRSRRSPPGAPNGQELLAPLAADGLAVEAGQLL